MMYAQDNGEVLPTVSASLWSSTINVSTAVEQCPDVAGTKIGYGYWNYLSGLKLGNAMLSTPDSCPMVSDATSPGTAPLANVIYSDDTYGPSSNYVSLRHNNGQITAFLDTHVAYATSIPDAPLPPGISATLTGTSGVSINGNNVYANGANAYAWSTNTITGNGYVEFNIGNDQYGIQCDVGIMAASSSGAVACTSPSQLLVTVNYWGGGADIFGPGGNDNNALWYDKVAGQSSDVWIISRTGSTVKVSKNGTVETTIPNITGPIEFACYQAADQAGILNVTMSNN
jgi:hypothetical protein